MVKLLNMKKRILSLVLASLASGTAFAQTSTEFFWGTGFSSYLGDLQPRQMTWENPGLAGTVGVRQNINAWIAFSGFASACRVSGSDIESRDQDLIYRNLSFRTNILEFGGQMEVNVLPFDAFNPARKSGGRFFNWSPYATIGLNIFHFNPQTLYQGAWVDLQPLNTEGQGSSFNANQPYKLTQAAIPFGFGFKWQVSRRSTVSYEFRFRKTFTDYLDDVSGSYADPVKLTSEKGFLAAELAYRTDELSGYEGTKPIAGSRRGDPANMDWYNMQMLTYSFKLYPAKRAFTGR
jgi:hypothetical protein